MFEGVFPSFLITFREALEAALIVAIVVSYLSRVGKGRLTWYAYLGSGIAVLVSLIIGVAVQMIYGGLDEFTAELFEGLASLTAVAVLTYMIFWMAERSKSIRSELQRQIDVAIGRNELYGIAVLAFVAVVREGLETVLFLSATFFLDAAGTLIGASAGAAVVLVIAALLIRGSYRLNVKKFFSYTSILLVVFAAGLSGYGIHELIEAGDRVGVDIGVLGDHAFDINPPQNPDGSYPVLHERGAVGSILKALVGYDGNPEWLRVIAYLGYWIVVGYYLSRKYKES